MLGKKGILPTKIFSLYKFLVTEHIKCQEPTYFIKFLKQFKYISKLFVQRCLMEPILYTMYLEDITILFSRWSIHMGEKSNLSKCKKWCYQNKKVQDVIKSTHSRSFHEHHQPLAMLYGLQSPLLVSCNPSTTVEVLFVVLVGEVNLSNR